MKNLFFVAVTVGFCSGTSFTAKAQTSINLEKVGNKGKSKISLKFIDNIEINPGKISGNSSDVGLIEKNNSSLVNTTLKNTTTLDIEKCSPIQFKYAMIMDREVETITNTTLYDFIDEWWGTRYRYGGTTKNGVDCSSFTRKVLESVYGITAPRTAAEQYDTSEKLAADQLVEGDLVFFNTRGGVSHVGIYLGDNYFAHSSIKYGVTISSLKDDYYSRKFIGGGRVCK
jgi:hypothetical protein